MATITPRGYTEADWLAAQGDPVLADREIGFVTDTGEHVLGDGATAFSALTRLGGQSGAFVDLVDADETVTVGSGGDYATINAALSALSKKAPSYVSQGHAVEVSLLAGFVMSEQVFINGLDLGWITITSVDATVTIDRSALTVLADDGERFPAWNVINGANSPVFQVLFDMDTSGVATQRCGFVASSGSTLTIASGAGCTNAGHRGVNVGGTATLFARGANFSGAGNVGARVSNGASALLTLATITGCGAANVAFGSAAIGSVINADLSGGLDVGLEINDACVVIATGANVSGAAAEGVNAQGGVVTFRTGDASGCGTGISADGGAVVDAAGSDMSGATTNGILATGGAHVIAGGANARKGVSDSATDVVVTEGGMVEATGLTGGFSITANIPTRDGTIYDTAEPSLPLPAAPDILLPALGIPNESAQEAMFSVTRHLGMLFHVPATADYRYLRFGVGTSSGNIRIAVAPVTSITETEIVHGPVLVDTGNVACPASGNIRYDFGATELPAGPVVVLFEPDNTTATFNGRASTAQSTIRAMPVAATRTTSIVPGGTTLSLNGRYIQVALEVDDGA